MAETDFHTAPEVPETPAESMAEVLTLLRSQGEILEEVAALLRKAAPLLDSRAAKVALGMERHPVLAALGKKGAGRG